MALPGNRKRAPLRSHMATVVDGPVARNLAHSNVEALAQQLGQLKAIARERSIRERYCPPLVQKFSRKGAWLELAR